MCQGSSHSFTAHVTMLCFRLVIFLNVCVLQCIGTCIIPAPAPFAPPPPPGSGCHLTLTLYTAQVTWSEASWTCQNKGGQLVRMDSYTHYCAMTTVDEAQIKIQRMWTGVYNSTPGSTDFTRGDCEELDWWDWIPGLSLPLPDTSCVTADVSTLKWKPQRCTNILPFLCELWEWKDSRSCRFKSISITCVWDAEHIFRRMATNHCEATCADDLRCWGYIQEDFRVTNDSYDIIPSGPGCTMIIADHLSTCRAVNKPYTMELRLCYKYLTVSNPLGHLPSLPDGPGQQCHRHDVTNDVTDETSSVAHTLDLLTTMIATRPTGTQTLASSAASISTVGDDITTATVIQNSSPSLGGSTDIASDPHTTNQPLIRSNTTVSSNITSAPTENEKPKRLCYCHCQESSTSSNALQQAVQDAVKLQTALTVPKATLSATRRKKESAPDPRDSARYAGYVGVAVIVIVALSIVMLDLQTVFLKAKGWRKPFRM